MDNSVICELIRVCDGWSILPPDLVLEMGLPEDIATELTERHESDFSRASTTIYVDDIPVDYMLGINSLDLLRRLAEIVNADCSAVVATGRGTRARQYKAAIEAATTPV